MFDERKWLSWCAQDSADRARECRADARRYLSWGDRYAHRTFMRMARAAWRDFAHYHRRLSA